MELSSFFGLSGIEEEGICLICNKIFGRKDMVDRNLNQTEKWSRLKIHKDNNEYVSTLVHNKLSGTRVLCKIT